MREVLAVCPERALAVRGGWRRKQICAQLGQRVGHQCCREVACVQLERLAACCLLLLLLLLTKRLA